MGHPAHHNKTYTLFSFTQKKLRHPETADYLRKRHQTNEIYFLTSSPINSKDAGSNPASATINYSAAIGSEHPACTDHKFSRIEIRWEGTL